MSVPASLSAPEASVWTRSLPWFAALITAVAGAIGLASLWPMLNDAWSNIYGAFSHGYLVLGLCVWLAICYWRNDSPARLQPSWLAALPLLGTVLLLIAMDVLFLNSTRLSMLPLVFLAAVALVFGVAAARTLLWPTLFLYFALPQWWAINGLLQSITSSIVSSFVSITGLPAYVEGNFIHVPAGTFEIASGCSGLNYLVAALSLAGFYALMHLTRWKSRLILLAAAAVMAMLSNFVRIYALIVIGIASDMQHYLIRVEHLYFGWVLFMILMIPVLLLARRLDDADIAAPKSTTDKDPRSPMIVSTSIVLAAVVAGLIMLLPAFLSIQPTGQTLNPAPLAASFGAWHRNDQLSPWQPVFVNAEAEAAQYAFDSDRIDVYRASYPQQTSDARLIRTENDFFGPGWRLAEQSSVAGDETHAVIESRGYLGERERLIWSWYVVAGHPTSTKLGAKLQELRGFAARRRDAAAIAISTECVAGCAAAQAKLQAFMQESAASLR